jgi:hypothetical protein
VEHQAVDTVDGANRLARGMALELASESFDIRQLGHGSSGRFPPATNANGLSPSAFRP